MTTPPPSPPSSPVVSVITGLYNSAPYLDQYFAALAAQTFADWEAILVDDGSRDDTVARVRAMAARDPRVILLEKAPEGFPSRSRQKGLEAARGRYVAFVDHDDFWAPQKLAMQVAVMAAFPDTAILHTDRVVVGAGAAVAPPAPFPFGGVADVPVRVETPAAVIYGGLRIVFSSFLAQTALVRAIGLHPDLKGIDDFYLFLRLAEHGAIRRIDLPLTYYAAHQGNLSHTQNIFVAGLYQVDAILANESGVPPVARRAVRAQAYRTEAVSLFSTDRPRALRLLVKSLRHYFIATTLSRLVFLLATFFVPLKLQQALVARAKRLKFAYPTWRDLIGSAKASARKRRHRAPPA